MYNVLIEDAAEAEEFLEAAEAGEEFLEAAEAFAVLKFYILLIRSNKIRFGSIRAVQL